MEAYTPKRASGNWSAFLAGAFVGAGAHCFLRHKQAHKFGTHSRVCISGSKISHGQIYLDRVLCIRLPTICVDRTQGLFSTEARLLLGRSLNH